MEFTPGAGDAFENHVDNRRRKAHGGLVEQQEFW